MTQQADDIVAKDTGGGDYERPPEGGHATVCADVIDLGFRFNPKFGKIEHKCAIVFQLGQQSEKTGKRFEIASIFTVSFHEKANLRKFLSQWRGKSYGEDEAQAGAPLKKLQGNPAYITIEHKPVGDKVYANVIGITKLPVGLPILEPEDYVRSERWKKGSLTEAEAEKFKAAGVEQPTERHLPDLEAIEDDDDLPFS